MIEGVSNNLWLVIFCRGRKNMGIILTGFSTPVIGAEWEYMDKKKTVEETPFPKNWSKSQNQGFH